MDSESEVSIRLQRAMLELLEANDLLIAGELRQLEASRHVIHGLRHARDAHTLVTEPVRV